MKLLIIGSLDGQIGAASQVAIKKGGEVLHTKDIDDGVDLLCSDNSVEIVMIDVTDDVSKLCSLLKDAKINVPVVACGTSNNPKLAVQAIKGGAKEYIPMPPDAELIGAVLATVSVKKHDLIYKDPAMSAVVAMAEQVAKSEASVLITGESGTGKEIIARHVHTNSRRATGRFVAVNCAAIPENLLESELFGYEKGAFTGAVARRIGKFEEASGGTLLLDEISEMDIRLQAKLLRAIQEREIDRIGGKAPIKVDVRILATSNRNMLESVQAKTFREDLYYRLNVVNVAIPPLRARKQDVLELSEFFIKKYSELNGLSEKPLTKTAKEKLLQYNFPGNVRELENTIHRAVLLAVGDEIDENAIIVTDVVADETYDASKSSLVGRKMVDVERDLIIETLKHTLGNRTMAASILGISIRTLRNKLKQYVDEGLDVDSVDIDG